MKIQFSRMVPLSAIVALLAALPLHSAADPVTGSDTQSPTSAAPAAEAAATTAVGDEITRVAAEPPPEQQPIDVLRQHIDAGIAVLTDSAYDDETQFEAQQQRLCEIAHEMFDAYAFARLTLAANWADFSSEQQQEFIQVFSDFLCRYYLSRLQRRYSDETVTLSEQTLKSATRASVKATIRWNELDVDVEVRMTKRNGRWRAYDMVAAGISAVLLYRAQFETHLLQHSPEHLIDTLRQRMLEQG